MGFPTPLNQWLNNEASDFVRDIFSSSKAQNRELINNKVVLEGIRNEGEYGRKIWGLLCLEIWQQEFHDKEGDFKKLLE